MYLAATGRDAQEAVPAPAEHIPERGQREHAGSALHAADMSPVDDQYITTGRIPGSVRTRNSPSMAATARSARIAVGARGG